MAINSRDSEATRTPGSRTYSAVATQIVFPVLTTELIHREVSCKGSVLCLVVSIAAHLIFVDLLDERRVDLEGCFLVDRELNFVGRALRRSATVN